MYRACSRCGKIHRANEVCRIKRQYKSSKEGELRNTYSWHKKAEEIKEKSKYLCSLCLEEGIYNYNSLEVHHIDKVSEDESRLLDDYNLICLCTRHHKEIENNLNIKDKLFELAKNREDN